MYCRYPWGQEAFDKARTEDKPIFLSGERCSVLIGVCESRNVFSICLSVLPQWATQPATGVTLWRESLLKMKKLANS